MVAMNVWPTDGADGSVANEARWRKMGRHFAGTGVLPVGNLLAPSLAFPNLTIKDGAAWVDGAFCELLATQVLAATANGIAVVRFDPAANTAELLWRDGVSSPAQSPTGTYELLIARTISSAMQDARTYLPASSPVVIGYAQVTTTQSVMGSNAWTPVTGLACNIMATAGRAYRLSAHIQGLPLSNAGPFAGAICDQSGQLCTSSAYLTTTSNGSDLYWSRVMQLSAGAHNLNVQMYPVNQNASSFATVANPSFLLVEDLGPQPFIP